MNNTTCNMRHLCTMADCSECAGTFEENTNSKVSNSMEITDSTMHILTASVGEMISILV